MRRNVMIALTIGGSLLALGLISFVWIGSRDVVGERAALETLRRISEAQTKYLAAHGEYGAFDQLIREGYLEEGFAEGSARRRYVYEMTVVPRRGGEIPFYGVSADPREETQSGARSYIFGPTWRHFYLDSRVSGIRVNEWRAASAGDPPLKD